MKRLLKWLLGLILLIPTTVLVVILLLAILLFTNTGLSSGVWLAQKLVSPLSIGEVEGSVWRGFTLRDVRYQDPDLGISAELQRFDFSTSIDCLFKQSICIDAVAINGLKLDMPTVPVSEEQAEPETESGIPAIFTPIPISLTDLKLNDINVNALGYKVSWKQFSTGLRLQGRTLTVRPTQWKTIRLALPNEANATSPEPKDTTPLAQRPDIELPTMNLPFTVRVEQFDARDFVLQQDSPLTVNHLGFNGGAAGIEVNVPSLVLDMPELDLKLNTKVFLSKDYPLYLKANADIKLPDYQGQKIDLDISGTVADFTLSSQLSGLAQGSLNGRFQPLKAKLPFAVTLSDVKTQWPLKGEADYNLDLEQLDGRGSLDNYELALRGKLEGKEIPQANINLNAQGSLDQIEVSRLSIDTLGGNLLGQVVVNWSELLNWQAVLGLTNIQPGVQWSEAEGVLNGNLINVGTLTQQGGWRVAFPSLSINGDLRGYPLVLKGRLSADDVSGNGQYRVRTTGLNLAHGENSVRVKGKLDNEWNMDAVVNLAKLSDSIPQLSGQIRGEIQLRGQQKTPSIVTNLNANQIDWNKGEATLSSLLIKGQVSPLPAPSGDIQLIAENGSYQNQQLKDLMVNFKGDQQKHQLNLDATTNLISTQMSVSGGLDSNPKQTWQGQLQSARIALLDSNTPAGNDALWQIDHPVNIRYGSTPQMIEVQAHCWQSQSSKICLDKDLSAGESGEANLSIQQFSFAQLKAFLPPETVVNGQLNATAWAKWAPNTAPQVKLSVDVPAGRVTQKLDTPLPIDWDKLHFSADLKQNKLDLNWLLQLTRNGKIEGQATIPNVTANKMSIDGKNSIQSIHFGFLRPLLGQQNNLNAELNSELNFKGPMLNPKVVGNLDIEGLKVEGQMFPVDIHKGEVKTQFNGYSANLASELETADGNLNLQGEANWAKQANWYANLRAYGDELKVDTPPVGSLKVKPDLTIAVTPQLAKITGNIDIPWGRILVEELPESAVGVSKDEVLLDENLKPLQENNGLPMALETDVTINIGNDVSLSAFGLKGNLVGSLKVSEKDKGPFILGEVRIEKGYYQSFGQDLIIQEGKILMNGPADQPYLAIKAIRNPDNTEDDVIAGIQVTGPADAPEVTVFSEPAMSQTSALSYLLRGRDVDDGSGGSAMTTALIGLSLAKSGKLVGELGEAFGVQDLQLGTAGSGDDSQVTVSGYIAPGLQVKYGVGIFNALGEFTVRYELFTNFYVEAVTGVDSAVDFLYQFSFN